METFELPDPQPHQILVGNACTQVSAGSEANFLRFGPQSYGLPEGTPRANIGYMAVGRILALGSAVQGFVVGDRVTTGSPHASHSLVEVGPAAAIDPVPEGVSDEIAGFASLGDVALHGVRRAGLQIDQSVAIFGLGIVGQLALQLARISGAYPLIALDLVDERLELARRSGVHPWHQSRARGRGAAGPGFDNRGRGRNGGIPLRPGREHPASGDGMRGRPRKRSS